MYKICIMSFLTLMCCIGCTESNGDDKMKNRSNPTIGDVLWNTTADTVFYERNDDIIIGEVQQAKYHNDDIYLIDKSSNKMLSFTAEGEFTGYVGGQGRGPGEYLEPVSFTIFDNNMVLLDRRLNRLSHFIFDEAVGGFQLQKSAVHDLYMTDICEVNGRIWVYGYKEGHIIHELSSNLEYIERSGGDLSAYEAETIQDIARDGTIACTKNYIYSAFMHDNTVHLYSQSDLSLSDQILFEGIAPIQYTTVEHEGRQAVALSYYQGTAYNEKGNYHDVIRNLIVAETVILAQYNRHYQDYKPISPDLMSFIVEPRNHTYKLFDDYPYIKDFNNGNYLTIIQDSVTSIVNRKSKLLFY